MVTEQLNLRKVPFSCFHSFLLWLLIAIMKEGAEQLRAAISVTIKS